MTGQNNFHTGLYARYKCCQTHIVFADMWMLLSTRTHTTQLTGVL